MNDSAPRYTRTAALLHWITVALVLAGFALGLTMTELEFSPAKFRAYAVHKWIGITVFLVAIARLSWRAGHPPPPVAVPAWQRRAAAGVHGLLYALTLAVPLSGWLYSSATGVQVVYLGLLPLPDLVAKDRAVAAALKLVHVGLNSGLALLVFVHVAAALKHHFGDRDGLLARMDPRRRAR
jgi:cytochrome b561